jgi:AraC-like DNA-binding protein
MMPEMDGMEFSRIIKSDMRTNHIPFIFLTAKDGAKNLENGLEVGAEDYIVKPFDIIVLQKKIRNLLKLIEVQREKQRKLFLSEPEDVVQTSEEDEFLKKATKIIRENINDPHFNAMALSNKMAISKRHLFRKLKQMNLLPAGFIDSTKQQFAHEYVADSPKIPENDVFIQRAQRVIYANINNSEFDAVKFSVLMGLSYQQLHRKIKSAINMTAIEFIRTMRMKRAAELLKTGKYRISEVMFDVGFDDPSYFARIFKEQFGKTPTEFMNESK